MVSLRRFALRGLRSPPTPASSCRTRSATRRSAGTPSAGGCMAARTTSARPGPRCWPGAPWARAWKGFAAKACTWVPCQRSSRFKRGQVHGGMLSGKTRLPVPDSCSRELRHRRWSMLGWRPSARPVRLPHQQRGMDDAEASPAVAAPSANKRSCATAGLDGSTAFPRQKISKGTAWSCRHDKEGAQQRGPDIWIVHSNDGNAILALRALAA